MKQKDILLLTITTFLIIVAWIGFSIYHNFVSTTISQPISEKIIPISPDFDTKILDTLQEREDIQPDLEAKVSSEESFITNISQPIPVENISTNSAGLNNGGAL